MYNVRLDRWLTDPGLLLGTGGAVGRNCIPGYGPYGQV